jgi:hypothetical protein
MVAAVHLAAVRPACWGAERVSDPLKKKLRV